jgi:hypothetical protein
MDERTKALFAGAERSVERVIGLLRMAMALSLGAVFAIAVVTYADSDDAVLPIQIAATSATIISTATRCEGIVDQFVGDAAMLVFGLPSPRPDGARRALTCALALLAGTPGERARSEGDRRRWGDRTRHRLACRRRVLRRRRRRNATRIYGSSAQQIITCRVVANAEGKGNPRLPSERARAWVSGSAF